MDDQSPTGSADNPIKSVGTTISIIEYLQDNEPERITRIAQDLNLSKSTIHKHLATLRLHDLVVRDQKQYRLGMRFLDFGGYVREQVQGSRIIKKAARGLADQTGETVQYMIEEGGRTVILYLEAGEQGVFTKSRVGRRFYLNQTAAGKAILAYMDDRDREQVLEEYGLPRATENTVTDRDDLISELKQIREDGVAYNYGERTVGLYAISVPIIGSRRGVIGAISVAGPSERINDDERRKTISKKLKETSSELSLKLSHME